MQKIYSRIDWENEPSTNTPLSESNLNKMDYALDQIDNRVVQLAGYQDRVAQSEKNAKTSEVNAKVSEINAKESEEKAKEYMESAFNGTPEGYQEVVEKVDRMEIKTTKENTIKGTKNGGFRLTKVVGNTIQNGTPSPENQVPLLSTGDLALSQGYWDVNLVYDTKHVCTRNRLPCKAGDNVKVIYGSIATAIGLVFYDSNMNILGIAHDSSGGVREFSAIAPTNTSYFCVNIRVSDVIDTTPQTVGKITLTINGKYLNCVKTHGKNFWKYGNVSGVGTKQIAFPNDAIPVGTYTLTIGNSISNENTYGSFLISFHHTDGTTTNIYRSFERYPTTIGFSAPVNKVTFYASADYVASQDKTFSYEDIQIEIGDATDYEPYKETVAYFLTDYPMIKGSTLFRENGLVKAMHTEKNVLLKNLAWVTYSATPRVYYASLNDCMLGYQTSRCSHFVNINESWDGSDISYSDHTSSKYKFFNTEFETQSEWEAWLAESNAELQYKLATPIIETLDNASQIALNDLETFDGVTHVGFDTRVQPLEFEAEVGLTNETARLLKAELRNDTLEVKLEDAITTMLLITP